VYLIVNNVAKAKDHLAAQILLDSLRRVRVIEGDD